MKNTNNILITPSDKYPKIQDAINAAKSGDIVGILPGDYNDSLTIINKDDLNLLAVDYNGKPANNYQVRFTGTLSGETGLIIQANNTKVSGLRFSNYTSGVNFMGNNNTLYCVTVTNSGRGLNIYGDCNKVVSCVIEDNNIVGITLQGNYNQIQATRINYNLRGIAAIADTLIGNIFYKNIITYNEQTNLRISAVKADKNVFIKNTISDSSYGLLCNNGRVAIIGNIFINHSNAALIYKDNNGIILDNSFSDNGTGMYLYTCDSIIAGNVAQVGKITGMLVDGNKNKVISNVVTSYDSIGLLVNGCKNNVCSNNIVSNKINLVCNSETNDTNCCYNYCSSISCTNFEDLCKYLEIFDKPAECFISA